MKTIGFIALMVAYLSVYLWFIYSAFRRHKRFDEYMRYSELLQRLCDEAHARAIAANEQGDEPALNQALAEWESAINKSVSVRKEYFPTRKA